MAPRTVSHPAQESASPDGSDDLTGAIVRTALESSLENVSPRALAAVQLAILDCLACTVAGAQTDGPRQVAQWAAESGGRDEATIIGTRLRTSPPLAALANGTAAHALDFD